MWNFIGADTHLAISVELSVLQVALDVKTNQAYLTLSVSSPGWNVRTVPWSRTRHMPSKSTFDTTPPPPWRVRMKFRGSTLVNPGLFLLWPLPLCPSPSACCKHQGFTRALTWTASAILPSSPAHFWPSPNSRCTQSPAGDAPTAVCSWVGSVSVKKHLWKRMCRGNLFACKVLGLSF